MVNSTGKKHPFLGTFHLIDITKGNFIFLISWEKSKSFKSSVPEQKIKYVFLMADHNNHNPVSKMLKISYDTQDYYSPGSKNTKLRKPDDPQPLSTIPAVRNIL